MILEVGKHRFGRKVEIVEECMVDEIIMLVAFVLFGNEIVAFSSVGKHVFGCKPVAFVVDLVSVEIVVSNCVNVVLFSMGHRMKDGFVVLVHLFSSNVSLKMRNKIAF